MLLGRLLHSRDPVVGVGTLIGIVNYKAIPVSLRMPGAGLEFRRFGVLCKRQIHKRNAATGGIRNRKAFMGDVAGSFAPAIFLLSDGEPTDEYASSLAKLKENNWFKKAIKVAVAIGEDANRDVLAEFTGNKEAVLTVHTPEALTKMIRFVSVTASQIGSKSSGVGKGGVDEAANKQDEMIDKISEVKAAEPDDDGDLEW